MGYLDTYAKEVLRAAAGEDFLYSGPSVFVNYGSGHPCRLDGTIGSNIAVQVESAYSKQVRGAILDLLCHPYPQKLLILGPNRTYDCVVSAYPCEQALGHFLAPERFRVVVLTGTPTDRHVTDDANLVRLSLTELRFHAPVLTLPMLVRIPIHPHSAAS